MATYHITSSLKSLVRGFDYIIVCKELKHIVVPKEEGRVQHQVELTEPIEYTRQEVLNLYDGNTKCTRWVYTYTEAGEDGIAIVLEEGVLENGN